MIKVRDDGNQRQRRELEYMRTRDGMPDWYDYLAHDSWRCDYYDECHCGLDEVTDYCALPRVKTFSYVPQPSIETPSLDGKVDSAEALKPDED